MVEEQVISPTELLGLIPTPLLVVMGEHRTVCLANAPLLLLLGRPQEDFTGRGMAEIFARADPLRLFEHLDVVYTTGASVRSEEILTFSQGVCGHDAGRRYFTACYEPMHAPCSGVTGVLVQLVEITSQVRARMKSAERQRRLEKQWTEFEAMYRTAPIGLGLYDAQTFRLIRLNDRLAEMFGSNVNELLGTSVLELAPDALGAYERFETVAAGGRVENQIVEGRLLGHTQATMSLLVNYFPFFGADGSVIAISTVVLDVTAQKSAEEALRRSEQWARLALDSGNLGTWDFDLRTHNLTCSPRLDQIFGYDEIAPEWSCELLFEHLLPGDHEHVKRTFQESLQQRTDWDCEARIQGAHNQLCHLGFRGHHFSDDHGALIYTVGVVADITKAKQAEAALLQSEKLAAVGRMASAMAHDINNPLESLTNLIFLLSGRVQDQEVHELLTLADQELRRVSAIANQTLRFHRQATRPQSVTAKELFAPALTIYERRLQNAHIQVLLGRQTDHPLRCFEGELQQVINNLVGNAVHAMQQGGTLALRSRVVTDPEQHRRCLVITIADSGTGMSAATQQNLFKPFFTTKGFNGTGLGLWLSLEIIERHRGQIRIRTSQEHNRSGTVVRLHLPLAIAL